MSKKNGEEAFHQYFHSIYEDRWPLIAKALSDLDTKVARRNLFFDEVPWETLEVPGVLEPYPDLNHCNSIDENFDQTHLQTLLLPYYRMDPASLFPALALGVLPGEKVLDMCAAPGGKTLVLMEALAGCGRTDLDRSGSLVANELSPKRRHRMMSVFKRHLPKDIRGMIEITGHDGSKIGLFKKEIYDRILLDAPCSGERGVLNKKSELETWKEKRSKSFGIRQYSLLSSAFMALKPGGRIVYSTCSLSPYENDAVIEKLIKRKAEKVKILNIESTKQGESTENGTIFLPDRHGWGPIYFSAIEKLSSEA